MTKQITNEFDYPSLFKAVIQRIAQAQQQAADSLNETLLSMYWDIGKLFYECQQMKGWGDKALDKIAIDLKNEHAEIKGFSRRNCFYMLQFYTEYKEGLKNIQVLIAQKGTVTLPIVRLTWTHNILLLKIKDPQKRFWYMQQTLVNIWSKRYAY